jgi:serine/threonine protein kinase/tetratricopeptide (TPR) repeat protein
MATDPERVKVLFLAAIERGNPADRRAFLDREVGDDAELRGRLDALLAAYDQPPVALDRPLAADPVASDGANAHASVASPPAGGIGGVGPTVSRQKEEGPNLIDTIIADRYKIRQEIGEGGMGTVYLAEQLRPVRRQVALKLIKPGTDSRNVLARFETERQALALMDHPNIAHVLDAGTTSPPYEAGTISPPYEASTTSPPYEGGARGGRGAGRPFFVMELVKGIPITEYCDAHRLDLNARLALFRQVCSAVQHAHQKGIIHRDLKPSNILVEAHDDRPVPKVIDFGLAKATSGMRLSEQSLFTAFGTVAGTPLYMAPEQATFNALDVDTRADIYALGVILYELLTGTTPISRESIQRAALDEMLRVIREVEPPAPSTRLRELGRPHAPREDSVTRSVTTTLTAIAAQRRTEPARLPTLVRGDLDWIVMKALAKERERRYASAVGLADDLEHHLNHEPVSAGPPTAAYRLRKFVRRNRTQVTAAALVLLALVLGVVGTTLGLFEARRQERQAEKRLAQVTQMNDILGSIFQDLNPANAAKNGKPLSAVLGERLDRATAEIEGEATGDPLAVARMQMTLGRSQVGLGYPDRAIVLLTKALATFSATLGPDHTDTLHSMNSLANGYSAAGQYGQAVKLNEETLALRKAKLGPNHPDTLASMSNLAISCREAGQNDRALKLNEETLALQKAKLGPDHTDTLYSMNNLAISYADAGQHDRALKLYEETLSLMRAKLGPDHPDTLVSMNNLANSYSDAGQNERALKLREEALAVRRAKLGPDHPETLWSMNNLADSYAAAGQYGQALKLREETLALRKAKLGSDHPDTLVSMGNLAISYADAGQHDRALKLHEETLSLMRTKLGPDHFYTRGFLECQAQCLANSAQIDRAAAILDAVIVSRRKTQGDAHPDTFRSRLLRADLDLARGRLDAADTAGRAILEECRARLGADDRLTIAAGLALGRVREARGDRDAAVTLYRAALDSARKNPSDRETLATALAESGRSRLAAGDLTAAEAPLREALAIREAEMPQHWRTAEARSLLGGALMGQKKAAEAAPLLRSGYEAMARSAAAIPLVDRPRLAEALDRLIAAGEAAGTKAELAAWKAEQAKLGAGGPKP